MTTTRHPSSAGGLADLLPADSGEMVQRCLAFDWAATPLGPVEEWSHSLRTTVTTILRTRHPMFLFWGPDLIQIYNDGYRPSLGQGDRHPRALGMRGEDFWTEIWDIIGPQIEGVMERGEATWHEDQLVAIERNDRIEEVYWTYSYSPVRDDDGSIGGTLVVCQETTARVIAERRVKTLHEIAVLQGHGSPEQAAREAARVLASDSLDAPFVLCYLSDGAATGPGLDLVFAGGVPGERVPDHWPLREAMSDRAARHVDLRDWPAARGLGAWPEPTEAAVVLPIASPDLDAPEGALVVGLSARLPWSPDYEEFLVAAANHIGAKVWTRRLQEERERRDRELELERSRLAYVFERAPAFLAVLRGPDHVFERANDAYFQLVGHRDIIGKPVDEALPEIRDQGFIDLLDGVIETGEPFVGREVAVTLERSPDAPAEERYLDFVYMPLLEADGSRSGVIAHGTDVTSQVRARREVERLLVESETARAQAEEASLAKTRFLANMSHELRTPINAIMGYADLIEAEVKGPLPQGYRDFVRRTRASGHHLMSLVNDILDLSRIEASALSVSTGENRLGSTVEEAQELVLPQAKDEGIQISTEFACDADTRYLGDPDRARQVLVNLLSNAIKFTDRGGRVTHRCSMQSTGPGPADLDGSGQPWIAIEVDDTGIGIPAGDLDRIFEPFVQLDDSTTRAAGGAGLGLAISRQLARMMGGDLTIESEPGRGTCVTLWLRSAP